MRTTKWKIKVVCELTWLILDVRSASNKLKMSTQAKEDGKVNTSTPDKGIQI